MRSLFKKLIQDWEDENDDTGQITAKGIIQSKLNDIIGDYTGFLLRLLDAFVFTTLKIVGKETFNNNGVFPGWKEIFSKPKTYAEYTRSFFGALIQLLEFFEKFLAMENSVVLVSDLQLNPVPDYAIIPNGDISNAKVIYSDYAIKTLLSTFEVKKDQSIFKRIFSKIQITIIKQIFPKILENFAAHRSQKWLPNGYMNATHIGSIQNTYLKWLGLHFLLLTTSEILKYVPSSYDDLVADPLQAIAQFFYHRFLFRIFNLVSGIIDAIRGDWSKLTDSALYYLIELMGFKGTPSQLVEVMKNNFGGFLLHVALSIPKFIKDVLIDMFSYPLKVFHQILLALWGFAMYKTDVKDYTLLFPKDGPGPLPYAYAYLIRVRNFVNGAGKVIGRAALGIAKSVRVLSRVPVIGKLFEKFFDKRDSNGQYKKILWAATSLSFGEITQLEQLDKKGGIDVVEKVLSGYAQANFYYTIFAQTITEFIKYLFPLEPIT